MYVCIYVCFFNQADSDFDHQHHRPHLLQQQMLAVVSGVNKTHLRAVPIYFLWWWPMQCNAMLYHIASGQRYSLHTYFVQFMRLPYFVDI